MPAVAAIYLSNATNPSYAIVSDVSVRPGDHCVIEFSTKKDKEEPPRDIAYVGTVQGEIPIQIEGKDLPKVVGKASAEEIEHFKQARKKLNEALVLCKNASKELDLNMKVSYIEENPQDKKITFFFTADKRVDFRELVKKLAAVHKCRIELWQIGNREETKAVGGFGHCGQEFCCSRFKRSLTEPISLNMAKDQDINLPPAQLTGTCCRLLCCLTYEHKQYLEMSKGIPPIGSIVSTEQGDGMVIDRNLLTRNLVVKIQDDGKIINVKPEQVKGFTPSPKSKENNETPDSPPNTDPDVPQIEN